MFSLKSLLKLFNVGASLFAVVCGIILFYLEGNNVVSFVLGVPIYALYPYSMIIFGTFGVITSLKSDSGLLIAFSAAAMFDMIGNLTAQYQPDLPLFVLWMVAIATPFLLEKKRISRFILSPNFIAYVLSVWLLHSFSIENLGEELFEILCCMVYYIGFYHEEWTIYNLMRRKHSQYPQTPEAKLD